MRVYFLFAETTGRDKEWGLSEDRQKQQLCRERHGCREVESRVDAGISHQRPQWLVLVGHECRSFLFFLLLGANPLALLLGSI